MVEIFLMFIIHWLADFILQSDADAKGKSSSWRHLTGHTTIYSMVWIPVVAIYAGIKMQAPIELSLLNGMVFALITFLTHTVTDYITSREVKKLFDKQDYHNGFVVIGFDQILHYTQLILTYLFLFGDGLRINI